jgi:hypothetical protein
MTNLKLITDDEKPKTVPVVQVQYAEEFGKPPKVNTGDLYWKGQYDALRASIDGINFETACVTISQIRKICRDTHDTAEERLKVIASVADAAYRAIQES